VEELLQKIEASLKWCRRHRREGIVGKDYTNQVFFKEKINLPKLPKMRVPQKEQIQYPPMPEDRILRALQHAFDEVGEQNRADKSKAMPAVAKHMAAEGREHNFATPRNIYEIYLNTSVEKIKAKPNE
jgi:hypothetical protein